MYKSFALAVIIACAEAKFFEEDKDHRYLKDYHTSSYQVGRHFFDEEMFQQEKQGTWMDDEGKKTTYTKR